MAIFFVFFIILIFGGAVVDQFIYFSSYVYGPLYLFHASLLGYLTLRLMPSFFLPRLESYNKGRKKEQKITNYMHKNLKIGSFKAFFLFIPSALLVSILIYGLTMRLFPQLVAGMTYEQILKNFVNFFRVLPVFLPYLLVRFFPIFFIEQLRGWKRAREKRAKDFLENN